MDSKSQSGNINSIKWFDTSKVQCRGGEQGIRVFNTLPKRHWAKEFKLIYYRVHGDKS